MAMVSRLRRDVAGSVVCNGQGRPGEADGMGFFRRSRSVPPAPPAPAPVVVGGPDLDRARPLFDQFERAVGTDPAVRHAVAEIALAGGAVSFEDSVKAHMNGTPPDQHRPWRWLAAVAREAQRTGDRDLVAHLALFVGMWVTLYDPHLTMADRMDVLLEAPPGHLLGEILSVALDELPTLPPSAVLAGNSSGRTTVSDVLVICANRALELRPELVDPSARATAQALVNSG
jgi:hypothetical protein